MTVLFVGLGAMGAPMVSNLSKAQDTVVYDVNREVSARIADTLNIGSLENLTELPEGVDTVVLMVPNSRIVESLLINDAGILGQLPKGSLVIDMSSSEPESAKALADHASDLGIDFVDAPVSGGVARAETGELAIMVGGSQDAFDRAKPILEVLGTSIHHVGGPGSGDAAKALNNLLSATNLSATAEILSAASNFGIEPETMLSVINSSTGRSQASEIKYPNFVLTGSFASGFGLDLMVKDLNIAHTLTSGAGLTAPVTDSAYEAAGEARQLLGVGRDHTEFVRLYEEKNSVALRARAKESGNI